MRIAEIKRKTTETDIFVKLNLDGKGNYKIDTPVKFLNHMLELFSKHSFIDLEISATGDTEIDYHHTVEDIAICLGQAFEKALGDKIKINRFGFFLLPMDESLVRTAIDINNRPHLSLTGDFSSFKTGGFDIELLKEFFHKLVLNGKFTLHIDVLKTSNLHHAIEAIYKSFAKSLSSAVSINSDIEGVLSTKGVI
jgi:imidazoleglycerol-phosphate dehydratase